MGRRLAGAAGALLVCAAFGPWLVGAEKTPSVEDGRKIYLEGVVPSGRPVKAIVAGDTEVDAEQMTCVSCHRRSGMGSAESRIQAPGVRGSILYRPARNGFHDQPIYDDASLGRAIRSGVDPNGKPFDPVMPRYAIDDASLASLVAYLKSLDERPSPGVDDEEIHFATVIAGAAEGAAMVAFLEAYFDDKNSESRHEQRRYDASAARTDYRRPRWESYRTWVLHVWRLEGPPDSWRSQIEALYAKQPVFALVSGVADGPWDPIDSFCEANAIPCILPNTELPAAPGDRFYTVYFSEGIVLEAKSIASHLAKQKPGATILQVRRSDLLATTGAAALEAAGERLGLTVRQVVLGDESGGQSLQQVLAGGGIDALVLWVGADDVKRIAARFPEGGAFERLYLSATSTGMRAVDLPAGLQDRVWTAWPAGLPGEIAARSRRLDPWLRRKGLDPAADRRIVDQSYFACMLTGEALMHVTFDHYFRDYFLESIDHMNNISRYAIRHPAVSFGPGQRYLSKGCYLIRSADPASRAASEWIVP